MRGTSINQLIDFNPDLGTQIATLQFPDVNLEGG